MYRLFNPLETAHVSAACLPTFNRIFKVQLNNELQGEFQGIHNDIFNFEKVFFNEFTTKKFWFSLGCYNICYLEKEKQNMRYKDNILHFKDKNYNLYANKK